jgi:hypothetical protein
LKFATWNVRGVHYKHEELDTVLNKNSIKLAAITETKKKLKGTYESQNYIIIYSGVTQNV